MASFSEVPIPAGFMDTVEHIDFNDPKSLHDRVLVVDDKKFYVESGILSLSSAYFRTLFQTNFAEAYKKEIPLPDVSAESFDYFLRIVYPGHLSEPEFLSPDSINPYVLLELISISFRFLSPVVLSESKKALGWYCRVHGLTGFDLVTFISFVLILDLKDFEAYIVEAFEDASFVSEKMEEIMNAPENVKNFALATLMKDKINSSKRCRTLTPSSCRTCSRSRSSSSSSSSSSGRSTRSPPARRNPRDLFGEPINFD